MRELKIGKHRLKIYDSIEELPIVRHHKFSKLMLIDANVGSDISDFDAHLERVFRYIRANKPDMAEKELMVLRQNVFFIQTEVSPKHLAFAALIHTLDGQQNEDLTDEALKALVAKLSDVTVGEMNLAIEESKKKLDSELQVYFPQLFDSAPVKGYYDKLKRRALLIIKKLTEELTPDEEKELDSLTTDLIIFSEPQSFSGPDSFEVQQDKQFENACLAISQSTNVNPKKFTVLEYYNALFFIKEQNKAQSKRTHKK